MTEEEKLLAEAVGVLEGVTPGPWHSETNDADEDPPRGFKYYLRAENYGAVGYWTGHKSNHKDERWYLTEQDARFIAWCREGVPALLARIAAQEAQIKGLAAEKRYWLGEIDAVLAGRADEHDRAEAAETALAAERAKVAKLVAKLADWEARIDDCEWSANTSLTQPIRAEMRAAIKEAGE